MNGNTQAVYLVRHGQTTAAVDRIIGVTDQPLSVSGKHQAGKLANSACKTPAKRIYCSGLSRSRQTAKLLQDASQLEIVPSELINEMNFGDWENQTWDTVYDQDPEFFNHWSQNWATVSPPNGECFNDVIHRCHDWYSEMVKSQPCIIVAHGGSLRALLSIMLEIPVNCLFNFELDHCHVTKINSSHSRAKAAYMNIPSLEW